LAGVGGTICGCKLLKYNGINVSPRLGRSPICVEAPKAFFLDMSNFEQKRRVTTITNKDDDDEMGICVRTGDERTERFPFRRDHRILACGGEPWTVSRRATSGAWRMGHRRRVDPNPKVTALLGRLDLRPSGLICDQ
jgi:hypothetical protein